MKILYIGSLVKYGKANTCLHRLHALKKIVNDVDAINSLPGNEKTLKFFFYRIINKLYKYKFKFKLPDLCIANKQIIEMVSKKRYDIIWIDKGLTITRKSLLYAKKVSPSVLIVGYSPDDMGNPGNQSQNLDKAFPLYDIFFTTKSYNVVELKKKYKVNAQFIGNAYNEDFHLPIPREDKRIKDFQCDVGFIGSYEKERAESVFFLAQNGVSIRVWGEGWGKLKYHPKIDVTPTGIYNDYPAVLSATKINLCFLRKVNRDLQTQRTMEIPATKSFMLAERTVEHTKLFKEGVEAEFFGSNKELLEKCISYLEHPDKITTIAINGYNRCIRSGYSNHGRMLKMITIINEVRQEN